MHVQAVAQLQAADTLAAMLMPCPTNSDEMVQRVRWRRMCAQAHAQLGAGCEAVLVARSGLLLALQGLLAHTSTRENVPGSSTSLTHTVRRLRRSLRGGALDLTQDGVVVCMQEATQLLDVMTHAGDRRAQRDARGVGQLLATTGANKKIAPG